MSSLIERSAISGTLAALVASGAITAILYQLAGAVVVWVQGMKRIDEIRATAQGEIDKIDATAEADVARIRAASEAKITEILATAQADRDRIDATAEADVARIRAASEAKITRDVGNPRTSTRPGTRPAQPSPSALRTGPTSAL